MLYKYNKKLIIDYIYGNDITTYSIDELEDNSEFMYDVMEYSKDKNFYNLCSDKVKLNYEFIKKIIILFKDDLKFIDKVASEYLQPNSIKKKSIFEEFELSVLMSNYVPQDIGSEYIKYAVTASAIYEQFAIEIAGGLSYFEDDEEVLRSIGKGFIIAKEKYGWSQIILQYVAKRIANDIFLNDDINFEEYIHINNRDKKNIEKVGIRQTIINIINQYDANLADYVQAHIDTISLIEEKYKIVLKNWEDYLRRVNDQKIMVIYQETFGLIESDRLLPSYPVKSLVDYAASILNYSDIIDKYDEPDLSEFADMRTKVDPSSLTIDDVEIIAHLKELMNELFIDDGLPKYKEEKKKNKKGVSRVIKFNTSDKKES